MKAKATAFLLADLGVTRSHSRPHTSNDNPFSPPSSQMLRVVRDEVFPHFRKLNGGTTFAEYMQDAQLMIQKPSLLVSAVNMIDKLPITEGDAKGDLYEYLLSKLTTAGINGQFRTPRHIIRFMVELLEPKPTWASSVRVAPSLSNPR